MPWSTPPEQSRKLVQAGEGQQARPGRSVAQRPRGCWRQAAAGASCQPSKPRYSTPLRRESASLARQRADGVPACQSASMCRRPAGMPDALSALRKLDAVPAPPDCLPASPAAGMETRLCSQRACCGQACAQVACLLPLPKACIPAGLGCPRLCAGAKQGKVRGLPRSGRILLLLAFGLQACMTLTLPLPAILSRSLSGRRKPPARLACT